MTTQMVHFLETNKILDEEIVGYRKGHSTMTALLKIRDDIIRAMKKGRIDTHGNGRLFKGIRH